MQEIMNGLNFRISLSRNFLRQATRIKQKSETMAKKISKIPALENTTSIINSVIFLDENKRSL